MKFTELLDILSETPVFRSSALRAGDLDPVDFASQLSRWVAAGKLVSLRRGVYAVAQPYARRDPHPFELANVLERPSYVSLESALSYHGLIPEAVFATTSVTTGRGGTIDTPMGAYVFRHVSPHMMWGYRFERVADASAFVARPEKALLDLIHLRAGGDDPALLRELRLERLEKLDFEVMREMADRTGKPKLARATAAIEELAAEQRQGWVTL